MKGNEFQLLHRRIRIDRVIIARVKEDANVDQGGNQRIAIHGTQIRWSEALGRNKLQRGYSKHRDGRRHAVTSLTIVTAYVLRSWHQHTKHHPQHQYQEYPYSNAGYGETFHQVAASDSR